MFLIPAVEADIPAVVELANRAYRGSGPSAGWNSEAGLIEGPRLTGAVLRQDLATKPQAHLLTFRDDPSGPLLGTVWLEPASAATWYLGLLTVCPDLQNRQLGRALLSAAEDFAKARGAQCISMSVINVRDTLISWYQRRGYRHTGETQPFPYGSERVGKPLRDDLHFVILERSLDKSTLRPHSAPAEAHPAP